MRQSAPIGPSGPTHSHHQVRWAPRQIAPLRGDRRLHRKCHPAVFSRPPTAPHLPGQLPPPRDRRKPPRPRVRREPLTQRFRNCSPHLRWHLQAPAVPPPPPPPAPERAAPVPTENRGFPRSFPPPRPGETRLSPGDRHPLARPRPHARPRSPPAPSRPPSPSHPPTAPTPAPLNPLSPPADLG